MRKDGSWGQLPTSVVLRLRAHRWLLSAALLSIVLTTCTVAALAAFGASVGDAGLRRALQDQSSGRTLVEVTADIKGSDGDRRELDAAVRKTLVSAYAGLRVTVASSIRSGAYALPVPRQSGAPDTGNPNLTLLATLDLSQVTPVTGRLPGPPLGEGPIPVALPEIAASAMKLRPGDSVVLADRLGGGTLKVILTGTYRPVEPSSSYWRLDSLGGRGVRTLSFTTYGPMLVDRAAFTSGDVPMAEQVWQGRPDVTGVTTARTDELGRSVRQAVERLGHLKPDSGVVASELPQLLDELQRTLLVSRSTLLVGAIQMGLLAALALLLVAGLLATERSGETAWLRARGGSRSRVVWLSVTEALVLAVPAAVVAPLLTGPLVRLLAGHGALLRAEVQLEPSASTGWWASAAASLACALIVLGPSLRRPGTYSSEHTPGVGRRSLPGALRTGADLALLAVAVLAFWQLSRRGAGAGMLTAGTGGALGVDPVLVVAPALCLLAGAVLALRLLPLAARLGERQAVRSRGLAMALTGWQLARRPGRGTAPVVLLVFATSIGIFAVGENASWTRSQSDQADFAVGSNVRVTGTSTRPFGLGGVYDHVPGISHVAPVARTLTPLPGDREVSVLAMDSTAATDTMLFRQDLGDRSLDLQKALRPADDATVRDAGWFTVPKDTARLRLTVRLQASGSHAKHVKDTITDRMSATFTDRYGTPYAFVLGDVPADGEQHMLEADFAAETGRTVGAGPAGPLRFTALKAGYRVPRRAEEHRLTVTAVTAVASDASTKAVPVADDALWSAKSLIGASDAPKEAGSGYRQLQVETPSSVDDGLLSVRYDTGEEPLQAYGSYGSWGAVVSLQVGASLKDPVPALATNAFLRAVNARVGDTVNVDIGGEKLNVRVNAAVRALPTAFAASAGTDGGALLVDLRTVNRALAGLDQTGLQPGEWWIATAQGAAPQVAAALRARGDITSLLVRDEVRAQLQRDPLGAGPLSALLAVAVAAAVLASVGFAAAAVGTMRERAQELALLSALGAARRSLARVVAVEQGLLVLVAVGVGALLGGLLTRLLVPLIVLTAKAEAPVPAVRVEFPIGSLATLLLVVAVVPLLVVALMALRSADPVQALRRQGGE
ncbi:FtsX-like permease family protein [Actinacidiphila glaucinigra]|uniref:FtsX-like permease family protein n=1 Tax=Actinacidiphila glaucinigra TaxID=235986 RepID=UPI0035E08BAA